MRQVVLADQYKTQEIIKEEREIWITNLLIMLGVPVDEIFEGNQEILARHDLQLWNDTEQGDVEIIQNNVLIGKWYAPVLFAKCDENNKVYYEIHLDYNSILDNEFNFVEADK
jgi:hypothetical protein